MVFGELKRKDSEWMLLYLSVRVSVIRMTRKVSVSLGNNYDTSVTRVRHVFTVYIVAAPRAEAEEDPEEALVG